MTSQSPSDPPHRRPLRPPNPKHLHPPPAPPLHPPIPRSSPVDTIRPRATRPDLASRRPPLLYRYVPPVPAAMQDDPCPDASVCGVSCPKGRSLGV
ncbi:hypothetical protein HCH54_004982 [Aspergillus fumigatus]